MPIVIAVVLLIGSAVLGTAVDYPMLVPLGMVVATTIWVHSDSDEIDYPDSAIEAKVLLLWIIFFPYYLYRRREVKIANAVSQRLSEQKVTEMRMTSGTSLSTHNATTSPSERACPECGETVLAVARKCKHCGSAIDPLTAEATPAPAGNATPTRSETTAGGAPTSMAAGLGRPAPELLEQEESKSARKMYIGAGVAVVALGAVLWFASKYEGPDPMAAGSNSGATSVPSNAVGQLVLTPKFGILVSQVDTPARVGNAFMNETPAEGGKYIAIRWEYQNVSSKPIGTFSQPTVHLEDPSGTRYDADVAASSAYAMQLDLTEKVFSDLNPGIKVRAADVFEIASSNVDLSGWAIVIYADQRVRIPLMSREPESAAVAETEAPAAEEAVVEDEVNSAEEPALPEFATYEVAIYDGQLYAAEWMTKSESGEWSDELGKPMDEPDVNFAGKYFIGLHSCGTGCRYYSMTDLSTGKSLNESVARFTAAEERPKTEDGHEYLTQLVGQADSNLLVAQYLIESPTEECREQAFLLEGETLRAISGVRKGCTEQ